MKTAARVTAWLLAALIPFLSASPARAQEPQEEELCNGIDDDLDGETDEGLGIYTCGWGVCTVTIDRCTDGMWQECIPPEPPVPEETADYCSDGLDNDCDAFTDDEDSDCHSGTESGCTCATPAGRYSSLLVLGLVWLLFRRIRKNR